MSESMNEAETRAELINEQLKLAGWKRDSALGMRIRHEYSISDGELQPNGKRKESMVADYVLEYRGVKLAVIEAKKISISVDEGIAQANKYAKKLDLKIAFAANGKEIYQIIYEPRSQGKIASFPSPQELWDIVQPNDNPQFKKFRDIPLQTSNPEHRIRYYQELAVNKAMEAIANGEKRILLTLATGTGKTFIASQIAWKLFESKWALNGERRPRILFLADRNILASQARKGFGVFDENDLTRITPEEIARRGGVPKNVNVYFAIFQTFMTDREKIGEPYYKEYKENFFDFIIIDECHRGGARDESTWRDILEYFESAVQLGLTATPKQNDNQNTYTYFGNPVFTYSLKEGIGDGFLTPFQVRYFRNNMENYKYNPDDDIEQGNIDEDKIYTEKDYNRIIEIEAIERKRVRDLLKSIKPDEKTIVFCANQAHAAKIRNYINEEALRDVEYCVRVTSNDGAIGDTYLQQFRDTEKTIPTILTTSQKLTTGVDALDVRNIVLLRPINSMIEFKQIIGRGTRIYDGKYYFTVIDFVQAYKNFNDPEWDGKPVEVIDGDTEAIIESSGEEYDFNQESVKEAKLNDVEDGDFEKEPIIIVKLSDDRERQIKSIQGVLFEVAGQYVEPKEYVKWLYEDFRLHEYLGSETDLCETWGDPQKRQEILAKLENAGCPKSELEKLKTLIEPENNDLFDVLGHVAYGKKSVSRNTRVETKRAEIYKNLDEKQRLFADGILSNYIKSGENEFNFELRDTLNAMDCHTPEDVLQKFGSLDSVRATFLKIQQQLYE